MKTAGVILRPRPFASGRTARPLVCVCVLFAVAVSLLSVPGVPSAAIDWTLSADIPKKPASVKLSGLDSGSAYNLWIDILVTNYEVTVQFVKALYDRGYNYGDIALLMEISQAAKVKPEEVAPYKQRGMGWGAIAKKMGVHPASFERAKGNDSLFRRYTLARCLANYYKMPDDRSPILLNEKGYSFDEITLAANVSAHSGSPLRTVISDRQTGMKWRFVAEKRKMSAAQLGTPPGKSPAKDKAAAPAKTGKGSKSQQKK